VVSGLEVRDIRVRVASGHKPVRFRVNGPYSIRIGHDSQPRQRQRSDWTVVSNRDGLILGGHRAGGNRAEIVPRRGAIVELSRLRDGKWTAPARYAGRLTFLAQPGGGLLAINSADLEIYVAGVLTRELYPDFHPEAYRAQAVAVRTYALVQMSRHAGRDYDVTNSESSQVYGGLPEGRAAQRAIEAARYTRGIVATASLPAGERIFCTYYSSACGGRSQDVADCKPEPSIPPLAGGVRCDWCRIAKGKVYRWGPARISKRDLNARLFARYPGLEQTLGRIRTVEVAARTRTGRPGRIRLVGTTGRNELLVAEDFRLAVGSRVMRSTDCRIQDGGAALVVSDGRGFGHGMGLCQWGMQGQALAGRKAAQILKFYYPGMHLTRAY
jgi:stage II sporulation protein D